MKLAVPRLFTRWYWAFRIPVHHFFGRWYIFRDAPDWVCAEYASFENDEDPDMRALAKKAIAELELRLQNIRRELEKIRADIEAMTTTCHTEN